MIKSLSIRNVGSNKKIDIKLDRYVTCITGESYTGKSWILRALKLLALNKIKSSGTSYINWNAKKATIIVDVGKYTIKRERSKTLNTYFVNNRKMEAFGSNVPDSVSKILNLSSINFQIQQEVPYGEGPLFWFALTPGQVSKRLNEIVNLDLIDRILHNLQSESHSAKSIVDVCRDRKKQAKQRVDELSFVRSMKEEWKAIEDLIEKTEKQNQEIEALKQLLNNINNQRSIIKNTSIRNEAIENDLQELESLRKTIINIEDSIEALSETLISIEEAEQKIKQYKKKLRKAEQEYEKAFGERCPLCQHPMEIKS